MTLTVPVACAVVVPAMLVALIEDTVSGAPPSETVAPGWKSAPAIVTPVPPRLDPLDGVIDVTVGGATYVKQAPHMPVCASGLVTTTFTAPAVCAVVVPVMLVA